MALTGSNLQAAVLRVGAKLKALLVICGHDSFDIFQCVWVELWVSQEFLHEQKAIYEDKSCYGLILLDKSWDYNYFFGRVLRMN